VIWLLIIFVTAIKCIDAQGILSNGLSKAVLEALGRLTAQQTKDGSQSQPSFADVARAYAAFLFEALLCPVKF